MTDARQAYGDMEVLSANPRRLVVMMFEAASRFLLQAQEAMERQDFEGQDYYLVRTQRIYTELQMALERGPGGAIAVSLRELYAHVGELLHLASLHDRQDLLAEAMTINQQLWEAWKEAEVRCQNQAA
ncbi:MAG TPA: flagellar export chaperone FliS [Armatimonadota bacterium]|jgi:flagellar protein FliS